MQTVNIILGGRRANFIQEQKNSFFGLDPTLVYPNILSPPATDPREEHANRLSAEGYTTLYFPRLQ